MTKSGVSGIIGKRLTDPKVLMWVLVLAGLFTRVWHYTVNHTIWFDEAALLLVIMRLDYAGLLGPNEASIAAPPLFMWLLRTLYLTVGDAPYIWRLVPFLFSAGGLLLTVPLARRLFTPFLATFAVGLVAVSDHHVWLGCCVKPYTSDTFIVTALLLYVASTGHWAAGRRLLVLAAAAPPLLGFSYTAVVALGAVIVALLPAAWAGGWRGRAGWAVAGVVAAGTLALLYFGPIKAQRSDTLVIEWARDFPDYTQPSTIPGWVVDHTLGACMYCYHPSGYALGLLAPLGVWGLWRGGRKEVATACVGMFVLAVAASAVKTYPYGDHRLSFFLAPAVVVLGVTGLGEIGRRWKSVGVGLAVIVFVVADAITLCHFVDPWHCPNSAGVTRQVQASRRTGDWLLSDDLCYVYYLPGEVRPLADASEVPVGGRAWVLMDDWNDNGVARRQNAERLAALGFEPRESYPYLQAEAWLWERTSVGKPPP